MKSAMQLEAGFQLSEGINIMNVETEEADEIQDTRA